MTISAKDVMALRQRTGLGMMDCKKALTETGGDMAQAEEILKAKLKGKMDTRSDRPASEGRLAIAEKPDRSAVAMIEVNTETDFTARNDDVKAASEKIVEHALASGPTGDVGVDDAITAVIDDLRLRTGENVSFKRGVRLEAPHCGHYLHHDHLKGVIIGFSGPVDAEDASGICQHITFADPAGVDAEDIPEERIAEVRKEAEAEAADSGKPADIIQKMVEGKVRKYLQEVTLVNQKYVKDPEGKKTVGDVLPDGVKILGFRRYVVGL